MFKSIYTQQRFYTFTFWFSRYLFDKIIEHYH